MSIERPRVRIRTALPNATAKLVHMTPDGTGNEFSQSGTTTQDSGASTTVVEDSVATFNANIVGAYVKMTSGVNVGLRRRVLVRNTANQITVVAFPANVVAGVTWEAERDIQTVRKIRAYVEQGGHAHLSPLEPAQAAYDPRIDDSLVWEREIQEGTEVLNILTTTDVSAIYLNIEAE